MCHRDLKLENTLLDGRTAPRLKICDFGYSKVLPSEQAARHAKESLSRPGHALAAWNSSKVTCAE